MSIYESQESGPGPAYVAVPRTSTAILVLGNVYPVDWQVDLPAGSGVVEVVLAARRGSTVSFIGAQSAPVRDIGDTHSCAYEIPDTHPSSGCETEEFQAVVEAETGLAMTSFQGCYYGGEFFIGE